MYLFIDESGDLGFESAKKGSTSFFIMTVLQVKDQAEIKKMRNIVKSVCNRKLRSKSELKGTNTSIDVKKYFYKQLISKECHFSLFSIYMEKEKISFSLKQLKKNDLHDYCLKLLLQSIRAKLDSGDLYLIIDKCKTGQSASDSNTYLREALKDQYNFRKISHRDSTEDALIQCADLFCWGIFRKHERNDSEWYTLFKEKLISEESCRKLQKKR